MDEINLIKQFSKVVEDSAQQNAIATGIVIVIVIVFYKILDYLLKRKSIANEQELKKHAIDNEQKQKEVLDRMVNVLDKISTSQEVTVNFITDLRKEHITQTKEQAKKIIELSCKRVEKDIFMYARMILFDDTIEDKLGIIDNYIKLTNKKLLETLKLFKFNNLDLSTRVTKQMMENMNDTILEDIDSYYREDEKSKSITAIQSCLKNAIDNYVYIITAKL